MRLIICRRRPLVWAQRCLAWLEASRSARQHWPWGSANGCRAVRCRYFRREVGACERSSQTRGSSFESLVIGTGPDFTVVAALELPPGSWVVFATVALASAAIIANGIPWRRGGVQVEKDDGTADGAPGPRRLPPTAPGTPAPRRSTRIARPPGSTRRAAPANHIRLKSSRYKTASASQRGAVSGQRHQGSAKRRVLRFQGAHHASCREDTGRLIAVHAANTDDQRSRRLSHMAAKLARKWMPNGVEAVFGGHRELLDLDGKPDELIREVDGATGRRSLNVNPYGLNVGKLTDSVFPQLASVT